MSQEVTNRRNQQTINAPFRVKSAGVSLVTILLIGMYYVANLISLLPSDEPVPDGALYVVITALVFIIVVEAALQIVLFIGAGQVENRTERDDAIASWASRNAYIVLIVGVFATFGSMFIGFTPFEMGSILLLTFLLAEIVKFASQIVYYRRSARSLRKENPMNKQLILSLTLLMLLLSGCNTNARDNSQAFPPDVAAEIQAEMDDLTAGERPPGMVVWIDAPEYRFEGASGSANLTDDTPMPPEGAFRIGSITKMFTATAIMQLAEDGVLTLDDPLALWLPEVAEQLPYGDQITLRHLLTHTSGLFNIVEHEAYWADLFTEMETDEAGGTVTLACAERDPSDTLARYVYGKDANFEPGARWSYSNTNYTLLGMVIEAAAEMPLAEAYRMHIYEPLGMTSTFLDCYEESLSDVVHGYTAVGDDTNDVTELHESIGWSAGGLVSTAPDLIAFARGLFGGALFDDPESLVAMTTPASGSAYGLGISLQGEYIGHAGYIAGFRSALNYAPALDTVVVMVYNHDGADPEQNLADMMNPVRSLLRAAE